MDSNELLNPLTGYKYTYKEEFHKNAEAFFDGLGNQVKVNKAANAKTCSDYYSTMNKLDTSKAKRGQLIALMVICIILGAIAIIAGIILLLIAGNKQENIGLYIGIGIGLLLLGAAGIALPIILIRPKISNINNIITSLQQTAAALLKEAYAQMNEFNKQFDWGIGAQLVTKTIPLIKMDKTFNPERFFNLKEKYGFGENNDPNVSTTWVQSGTILGNPFLIERNYCMEMGTETYTVSITISWTTTYSDKNGIHTQHHTQTLTASVTKPKPYYFYDTWLVYGNDAAPKLNFSRQPSKANQMDEKKIQKKVDNYTDELSKIQEKNIGKNNFTAMANTEFEYLFHALNRDNETEFRLLFTPLAQTSMLKLIKDKENYGDDFIFEKKKCLNYIKSKHSQKVKYECDPSLFGGFDYAKSKEFFLNYMDDYFKGLFFDLAPLFSIPLYVQTKSIDYIYKGLSPRNITSFESEVIANQFNADLFADKECDTDQILKGEFLRRDGLVDVVNIHSHGFNKVYHTDYISKLGGDGRMHQVPVTWIEYVPVEHVTPIALQNIPAEGKQYKYNLNDALSLISGRINNNAIISQRGIFSSILRDANYSWNGQELNNIFSHKED